MSDITTIRAQINKEIEAMQNAQRYTVVARHTIITHHYGALESYYTQLTNQVGKQQAIEEVINRLEELL